MKENNYISNCIMHAKGIVQDIWGGITFLVLFILLMAMYDLLKVMSQGSDDY